MTQEALEMLRKQLSSIIEELTDQKLQRLDNLSSWAKIDKEFEEWKAKINAEHTATEDEINSWRKRAKRLDEQDQRVLRRKHTVDLESPTASDLGSDEELHQNWQDYDYKDDFATIHDRIKDLDSLFWTEDEFFKKKFENISISNGNKFKSLQQKYSQTTHELQQRNDELTSKIHTIMSNDNGGDNNRYNDMDGDGTDSDDLEREDTEKYQKYIPPTVKHIHENSQAIQGINPQQLNAPNRDYENNDDDDINHINHINDRQKVMVLENTLKEYDEKIDHYISTVNRKDRELKELKQQVGYLEQMNETEEEFAALHDELERTKREKADLESKLSTSTLSSYHHISNLDKGSDDSSFNEPIPSEHPSPVLHPSDIDINIDNIRQYENIQYENELENEYKQEEKQSSPTIREKIGINGMNSINTVTSDDTMTTPITPDILYHLTHSLNVNDLPIHINSINEIDNNNLDLNNNKLSELFVGGGKQYWQNIKDSMISNEFYPSNTDAISETDILNEDVEIDISALGLPLNNIPPTNKNKTKNNNYNKLISPVTPVTPQPSQSRMIMKLKLNNKENNKNDPYQNVSSISTTNRQISSSDIDIEPEFDDDELKYTTGSDYTNGTTILSAPTNNASGVIPDNDTEIVPFAIAALFDNITDPNPITSESEMKITHNEHEHKDEQPQQHKIDEPPSIPPVLVSMQSIHDDNNNLISIDDVYEKISRHASNPEILIPGDTNDRNSQSKITIYTPIMDENNNNQIHEREKSLSPDKNDMNRNTSPSPDDQALKIDYQLETVAKSKIVRRLSFPLGRIDEHPIVPDYTNNTSPISPIDDDAPHAFGSLISNDNQNDNQNNEYKQEKDDGDIDIDDDIDDDNDDNDDDDDDELVKRLSTDKESVISDLETDENKDDLQSDHDNDNDSDNEIQIDRDHINDNDTNNDNDNDNEINDGSGGTGNDFRGKKDRGNHNNQEMYVFDEPVEPVQPIDSTDDNSIFDDFAADQKELDAMEQQNNNNNNNNIMDDNAVQLMKDNEIRLKAANVEIDKLEEQIEKIKTENNRLAVTKMESLNKLSLQIEEMRDEIQHQCQQLQLKDHTIKKLIHINKEGYDPDTDMDQKHDFETRKISNSLINGIGGSLGISNSLNGLLTFGRSKYSTCLHSQQTKKSKIDLAIETSKEIHRLREIIRVLSTNKTTNGSQTNNTNKSSKYGLFDGIYPGSK